MKAIDKDRSRRYDTANGFSLELRRFLDDEPVLARPPSPGYRLSKLEHQINNIRHVQHHAGLLARRLRLARGTDIEWVGFS